MSNDRQLTEEFEKLSARLSPQLDAARTEIREADAQQAAIEERRAAVRQSRREAAWQIPLWCLVLIVAPIPAYLVGFDKVGVVLGLLAAVLWLAVGVALALAMLEYSVKGSTLWRFRDHRGEYCKVGGPMWMERVSRTEWYPALPYFLWLRHQMREAAAERVGSPCALEDDRLEELRRLFDNIEAWDDDVKYVNRILNKVAEGIVPREDVHQLVANLREDECYLLSLVRCGEKLMEEGPLGTSLSKSTMPLVDRLDDRMTLVDTHRREVREFSGRIAGRMEVVRHK